MSHGNKMLCPMQLLTIRNAEYYTGLQNSSSHSRQLEGIVVVRPVGEGYAPYASANSVVRIIQQYRSHGLPDPLAAVGLEQIGMPPSMASFALRALVFLGLIDEGGNIMAEFASIRRATTEEYPSVLAETIRKAYLHVFSVVDPAVHDATRVDDAFRIYEPAKQRRKMVALFMGLCEEAGLVSSGTAKRRNTSASTSRSKRERHNGHSETPPPPPPPPPPALGLHPALAGLIADLPNKGPTWSTIERDRWLRAFENNLSYAYPAEDDEQERGE